LSEWIYIREDESKSLIDLINLACLDLKEKTNWYSTEVFLEDTTLKFHISNKNGYKLVLYLNSLEDLIKSLQKIRNKVKNSMIFPYFEKTNLKRGK
jgi:hypothetical protein